MDCFVASLLAMTERSKGLREMIAQPFLIDLRALITSPRLRGEVGLHRKMQSG
jgi:hypothetical protein